MSRRRTRSSIRVLRAAVPLTAAAVLAIAPNQARGQPSEADSVAEAREQARALAEQGLALLETGRVREAVALLERAESLFHAPTHLLFIARAQRDLGLLVEAERSYRALVDEELANYAPDAFRDAQREGRAELEALQSRVPRVRVVATGASDAELSVEIDGQPARAWREGEPVNPGPHVVAVRAPDGTVVEHEISTPEGELREVTVSVSATPDAAPSLVAPPDGADASPAAIATLLGFGLGGAGLLVGGITGAMSLSSVSELSDACPTKQCADEDRDLADSARTLGNVSTAGFIVGAVGVAVGVVSLVVWSNEEDAKVALRVRAGVGRAAVDVVF